MGALNLRSSSPMGYRTFDIVMQAVRTRRAAQSHITSDLAFMTSGTSDYRTFPLPLCRVAWSIALDIIFWDWRHLEVSVGWYAGVKD